MFFEEPLQPILDKDQGANYGKTNVLFHLSEKFLLHLEKESSFSFKKAVFFFLWKTNLLKLHLKNYHFLFKNKNISTFQPLQGK